MFQAIGINMWKSFVVLKVEESRSFAKQSTYDDIPDSMKLFIPFCRTLELLNTIIVIGRTILDT